MAVKNHLMCQSWEVMFQVVNLQINLGKICRYALKNIICQSLIFWKIFPQQECESRNFGEMLKPNLKRFQAGKNSFPNFKKR